MKYFEYSSPIQQELKELGYGIPIEPTEADKIVTKRMLSSSYSDLSGLVDMLEPYHIRDITKPMIRLYAYYINNPQQFNRDPENVIGGMVKACIRATCGILKNFYRTDINYIKAKRNLIKKHKDILLGTLYESSKNLAKRVEHNTLLEREDLNASNRIIEMLKR